MLRGGIGVLRELRKNERRVALTPQNVQVLSKLGLDVHIEDQAGVRSGFTNAHYESAGGVICDRNDIWNSSVVLQHDLPRIDEVEHLGDRTSLNVTSLFLIKC